MSPTLKHGQYVLVSGLATPKTGDVVVAVQNKKEVVKRIHAIHDDWTIELRGDNKEESIDSRDYGTITKRKVQGVVIWPKTKLL